MARYVRSKRRPAGELPPLPACACGAPGVVWASGRSWCDACANAHAEEQAAATLIEDLEIARIAAVDEDERRRGRPELSIACPKCHAEQGRFCRNYLGKKKPTCRERHAAPGAVAAHERYVAEARAVQAELGPVRERSREEVQAQLDAEDAARAPGKEDASHE